MTQACPAIREYGKNRGKVCGRDVVAFILPGHGRCGYHDTVVEKARALAVVRSIREMRALRGLPCPREGDEQREDEPQRDAEADDAPHFDAADFSSTTLDE